ncbi:kinase-like protein [Leishmania mexicana MHOM/GT/2001/U1103]|uniref:non-specific serine/threonine protein kinase n=1 Tax=Leishmania mexicana (strain MHOM/GT/2001/U1103) TaxID=929439 RepID=E9AUS3_LEIMU|nr:kinase-like protein [Leishmania mexicana MHOM/GT/2001/U1103]CBZ26703.1 kinase-like protein [Leishmania mexicana MHOM/GT/2001/U1103]
MSAAMQHGNRDLAERDVANAKNAPKVASEAEIDRRNVLFAEALRCASIAMRVGDDPAYIWTPQWLGAGSFGTVTLAYRHDGDAAWRKTAVKRLSLRKETRLSAVLEMVRCAGREVALCRRAGVSPHVVPMYEPWFDCREGVIALPMDAGDFSLERYAVHCGFRFPPLVLLSLCAQCARAVAHLHWSRVVHRDVKPENFVVNVFDAGDGGCGCSGVRPPLVRILDFGLACGVEEVGQELKRCVGTPHYMAPETFSQLCDCDVPAACDVWSLGVTLFRLATGVFPVFEMDRTWRQPPFTDLHSGKLWPPSRNLFHEPLSAESLAVLSVAASMLVLDPRCRPTADSVLLQLQSFQEAFSHQIQSWPPGPLPQPCHVLQRAPK